MTSHENQQRRSRQTKQPTTISYVSLLVTSQIVITITIAKLKDRVTNKEKKVVKRIRSV